MKGCIDYDGQPKSYLLPPSLPPPQAEPFYVEKGTKLFWLKMPDHELSAFSLVHRFATLDRDCNFLVVWVFRGETVTVSIVHFSILMFKD